MHLASCSHGSHGHVRNYIQQRAGDISLSSEIEMNLRPVCGSFPAQCVSMSHFPLFPICSSFMVGNLKVFWGGVHTSREKIIFGSLNAPVLIFHLLDFGAWIYGIFYLFVNLFKNIMKTKFLKLKLPIRNFKEGHSTLMYSVPKSREAQVQKSSSLHDCHFQVMFVSDLGYIPE